MTVYEIINAMTKNELKEFIQFQAMLECQLDRFLSTYAVMQYWKGEKVIAL